MENLANHHGFANFVAETMKRLQQLTPYMGVVAAILLALTANIRIFAAETETTDSAVAVPSLDVNGVAGVVIRDLATGTDIVSRNTGLAMTPASTLKCLTAAAAMLDTRMPECFVTTASADGPVDSNGTLWGNLLIMAGGDPTTESEYFYDNRALVDSITAAVSAAGIKKIKGSVIIDTSAVPDGGPVEEWTDDDRRWYYGAGHYALNYRDNTVKPDRALPDPPGKFFDDLTSRLSARGIETEDEDMPLRSESRILYTRNSPPMTDILRSMIVRSDNMFAEGVLRALAPGHSRAEAIARERRLISLTGADTTRMAIFDGSGLTRSNAVTPADLARVLQYMAASPRGAAYVALFPKAGVEGTVKRFLPGTPLEGRLVLKSGSVNGVQCYAGYRVDDNGVPTHVVVVMVNSFKGGRQGVVRSVADFLLNIFKEP